MPHGMSHTPVHGQHIVPIGAHTTTYCPIGTVLSVHNCQMMGGGGACRFLICVVDCIAQLAWWLQHYHCRVGKVEEPWM